jgi:fluoride exporter
MNVVAIALAGAVGTLLRYGLSAWLEAALGRGFPYGTFAVNVAGSFALGWVAERLDGRVWLGADLRLVLGVGLLGGFTTYSSFSLEVLRLLQDREWLKAGLYAVGTFGLCLAASFGGYAAGRALR